MRRPPSLALAVSVKVVPVVMLPALAVYVIRHRRDLLGLAATGFSVTFLALWLWPLLSQRWAIMHHVIGYAGIADREWGLVQLLSSTHHQHAIALLVSPGKNLIVAFCALAPAAVVWWRTDQAVQANCWSLTAFLVFSPAFGVQYLAWAAAPAFLLDLGIATAYNVLAGLFLFQVYNRWSGGLPWHAMARGHRLTVGEVRLGLVVWASLLLLVVVSALRLRPPLRSKASGVHGIAAASTPEL